MTERIRLWLVEPDPFLASILRDDLEHEGFEVREPRSVAEIGEACSRGENGIVVADLEGLSSTFGPGQDAPFVALAEVTPVILVVERAYGLSTGKARVVDGRFGNFDKVLDLVEELALSCNTSGAPQPPRLWDAGSNTPV